MMKKAVLNYWVDMATGAALLVCAVTGIVRLFPEATSIAGGSATIFGVSAALWATVHDWSGVAMAAGVAVHTALHLRWLVQMTGKLVSPGRRQPTADGKRSRPGKAAPGTPKGRADYPAATPQTDTAASLARLKTMGVRSGEDRRTGHAADAADDGAPLLSRKAFLLGAATVGGAALLVGAGLLKSADSGTAVADTSGSGSGSSGSTSGTTSGSSSSDSSSASGTASSGTSSSSTATGSASSTTRVVVDSAACVGCGHCVQACPQGVFTFSGGTAEASNAGACTLCGRCVQVCRPQAITLNG